MCFNTQYISFSTRCLCTVAALYITVISIYILSGGTTALHFIIAYGVYLQAPIILYRYQFYSLSSSVRDFFIISLSFYPIPQIWALYSIISLTTAVYSNCIYLKEGPQVNAVIYNAAINITIPLVVAFLIYLFQFSLKLIQTLKTLKVAFSSILYP